MAFFEDIGKKVSQTSQEAIKKTKIIAETTKINGQIAGEKRLIADNFSRLGETYFALYGDNPDENLAVFITAIKEASQRIADYEEQIIKLKTKDCCPICGVEIKEGALFCTACGAKLSVVPPEAEPESQPVIKMCANCGAQLTEGALFCASCGQKTDESST